MKHKATYFSHLNGIYDRRLLRSLYEDGTIDAEEAEEMLLSAADRESERWLESLYED
ncbi:MAG TPA: hypothetical protein PLU67_07275 [Candidatus Kapabacteria bacterium]|nr:hypothetical protein [Candidatus Kapabacteria bacterium]HOM05277.1 hypothetical protein [Candidatus Kapabacteria bacterium]HPP38694.1 hypothetical protein [Candidatus Kapabacteria bacterium]